MSVFAICRRRAGDETSAKRSAKEALAHRLRMHAWLRRAIQLAFFVLAPSVFSGSFAGIKYLCGRIGQAQALEANAFIVQLVAVLAFTCVFGRFFCGYACAFGALGDAVYQLGAFVRERLGLRLPTIPEHLVRPLSLLKYLVLAGVCAACFVGTWSAVSGKSPWVGFASVLSGSLGGTDAVAFALLAAVVCLMVLRERAFCQFLCPLGAIFSLMPVLPCSELVRTRAHCAKRCGRCQAACPVSIWPDADTLEHGECIACGRCADVCPMANVNLVALRKDLSLAAQLLPSASPAEHGKDGRTAEDKGGDGGGPVPPAPARPLRKTPEAWHLLRGTESWLVLLRAALLLLLFWRLGVVRCLPAPPIG